MKTIAILSMLATAMAQAPRWFSYEGSIIGPGRADTLVVNPIIYRAGQTPSYASQKPIQYSSSGEVLRGVTRVHVLYYGDNTAQYFTNERKNVIHNYLENISKTNYFGIVKRYYFQVNGLAPEYIQGIELGTIQHINCQYRESNGKCSLKGIQIAKLIEDALITHKTVPLDGKAVYLLVTAPDVYVAAGVYSEYVAGRDFCSYHSYYNSVNSGFNIKYAVVPIPTSPHESKCINMNKSGASPNGETNLDSAINLLNHELIETLVQPQAPYFRSWNDDINQPVGYELIDKCEQYFSEVTTASNGAQSNIQIGNRRYLLNPIFDRQSQNCLMLSN